MRRDGEEDAGDGNNLVQWIFAGLTSGESYDVGATWIGGDGRAPDAPFSVLVATGSDDVLEAPPCKIDGRSGQAAYDAVVAAARLALDRRVDGIVTGHPATGRPVWWKASMCTGSWA